MSLRRALGIGPAMVAAFVGGGGKTSLITALADECAAAGLRTIVTTTTRIFPPPIPTFSDANAGSFKAAAEFFDGGGRVLCLHRGVDGEGKLTGVDPETVERWLAVADVILVEADGARGLPLKAPGEGEPVIPSATGVLVPVAGMSAVGRSVRPGQIHRPRIVSRLLGVPIDTPVTPAMVARILLHPEGGLKGKPAKARVVPVVGQADTPAAMTAAKAVEERLLAAGAGRIVTAAPRTERKVRRIAGAVTGLVLAAGSARRWGSRGHKLLHPLQGRPIVEHALAAPLQADLKEVVVVTGARHREMAPMLRRQPVRVVHNPRHEEGMASSLRTGLAALYPPVPPRGYVPPEAFIVFLADQPFLTADAVNALVARWRETRAPVVAPVWEGRRRNPVLFRADLVPALLDVTGDEGGRSVARKFENETVLVPFDDGRLFHDVDSPEDLPNDLPDELPNDLPGGPSRI